jgi:hypothetical protein
VDLEQRFPEAKVDVRRLDQALNGLVGWLTSTPVVRSADVGAGVVSWLTKDGKWDGLYPEICGYYLQFAAQAAPAPGTGSDAVFRSAAQAVAKWLDTVGGPAAEPLTMYHRDMADSDWRNMCLFSFDLAIILRGFAAAEARWPGIVPAGAMDRYMTSIKRIVADGRLDSFLLRPGAASADLPVKWSTTQGVLHVKAVAALAGLGRPDTDAIVAATVQDEAARFARDGVARMQGLHPFLYFIEGWLTLWGQTQDMRALANARTAFGMLLQQVDTMTGEAPPIANRRDMPTRSDVLAQALRAGVVLEAAGQLTGEIGEMWQCRRPALHAAVLSRLAPEGGVIFDWVGQHRNAWASMFAYQALRYVREAQMGTLDPISSAAALI